MADDRLGADVRETANPAGPAWSTAPAWPTAVPRQVTDGIAEYEQSVVGQRSCVAPGFACIGPSGVAVCCGKVQVSVVVSVPRTPVAVESQRRLIGRHRK